MYEKYEEECSTIHKLNQRFQSESFSEMSSICNYPGKYYRSGVSTSTDETDNNDDIS